MVVFSALIISTASELKVQYIPDDAFYYLTLARNFSSLAIWTFDSGISVTSGFHPLFAYLLAGVYALLALNENSFLLAGIVLSLLLALAAVAILWFWGFKSKNVLFLMFLLLVLSARNFVYNTVSVTEWSLTLLIAASYCVWFFTKYEHTAISWLDFLVLFALGLLGSLSRTDFGLLPFSITFAVFVLSFIIVVSKRLRLFALSGLLGSLAGLFVVFAHNYLFTNEFLQSSAKMKAYWAQVSPTSPKTILFLFGQITVNNGLLFLALLFVLAIGLGFIVKENGRMRISSPAISLRSMPNTTAEHSRSMAMILSSVVCILGYALFYTRTVPIQPWYTANLILPVLMFIFGITDLLNASVPDKAKVPLLLIILAILTFNIFRLYPINTTNAPWPHQQFLRDAGLYLKESFPDAPDDKVGAWNAGITGYYEGGHVVNLDGLVNNDIYNYAINNDLPAYLASTGIHTIVDFENMLADQTKRIRGGYDDPEFLGSLEAQKVFDNGEYPWKHLTLYHVP